MGIDPTVQLRAAIGHVRIARRVGRVAALAGTLARVTGLSDTCAIGDHLRITTPVGPVLGEVVALTPEDVAVLVSAKTPAFSIGAEAVHLGPFALHPDASWLGRIVTPFGEPLDGRPILPGEPRVGPREEAPVGRRGLGARLETGWALFNTMLPIARGQRIGLFSGSGVGKSTLLGQLATGIEADVVVIALVGERSREVRVFADQIFASHGQSRTVIVAATADASALERRQCPETALTIAEHFRDAGLQVLLLVDSITRLAEAHIEVASAAGGPQSPNGMVPSLVPRLTGLAERAGPGSGNGGDITAIFSVLVAASDMDSPVADCMRGVLDGHIVLDRSIAERGRFPAIDVGRSVSRALPAIANDAENQIIADARRMLGLYENAEMMIRAGLYSKGSDPELDRAVDVWPRLDRFFTQRERRACADSFMSLRACLEPAHLSGESDDTQTSE